MKSGKRKRLWKWVALGGGALLLLGVLLAALWLRPHPEYEFLAGHRPVSFDVYGPDRSIPVGAISKVYSFEAEFDEVVKRMESEIGESEEVLKVASEADWASWYLVDDRRSVDIRKGQYVPITGDMVEFRPEQVWVTVWILDAVNPTWLDRLKVWLYDRGL
ncbi:MAG: hypothetical protein IH851_05585 [Armatimonadetes bacterium]|nr:hypothetical protein [Armatimonadota bacterium]